MQPSKPMPHALKAVLAPKVVVPIVVGVALLVALIAFAGPQQAVRLIARFQPVYLLVFLLLMAGYELVRCALWLYLLRQLDLCVPLRTGIFSYAIGEVTKNLPIGNFVPDYVLTREQGTDFGRASSSTFFVAVVEVAVALTGIVIIGIDDWTWLRPLILIGSTVFVLLAWTFSRWYRSQHPAAGHEHDGQVGHQRHHGPAPGWAKRVLQWKWVQSGLQELHQFTQGEGTLLHPHVIAISMVACAVYMVLGGLALFVVLQGLGLSGITWAAALSASFFSLAVATIIPIPTDLGSSEASGAGALVALGLAAAGAVSALLLYRFLNLVEQVLVALLTSLALPGEFAAMWRERKQEQLQGPSRSTSGPA
jgi:uncharacterized protein (TIRG00374 family)